MSLLNIPTSYTVPTVVFFMRKHINKFFYALAFVVATILFIAPESYAQSAPDNRDLLANLYSCGVIKPLEAQSNCYEKAATALKNAEKTGDVLIISKQDFQTLQERTFGFKDSVMNTGNIQAIKSISVPVKKVERYLSGYVVSLDNDQVWEQFAGSITRVPKGQLFAKIDVTPTGTYKMVLFNDNARVSNIRVRRIK